MTSTTVKRTFPVWPTVARAFASVAENWLAALRVSWAWVAALLIAAILLFGLSPGDGGATLSGLILSGLLLLAIMAVGLASTAVAWHRLLLLGERQPAINLRVDGQVLPYLGRLLLMLLIAVPLELLTAQLLTQFGLGVLMLVSPVAYAIIALIVALPTIVIFARLGICLPGIAIGRPMTLSESWRLTDGNTVQLSAGTLLIYLPFHVVGLALSGQQTNAALGWVLLLAGVFSYIAGISFLSFTYRFFVDAPEAAPPQSSSDGAAGT